MFVGREKELVKLRQVINTDKKEAVLIYGKRRIGKSTLITEAAKDFDGIVIEYVCVKSTFEGNLELLNRDVAMALGLPDMHLTSLSDIFRLLSAQDKPVLIVLDEYQYMKESAKKGEVDSYMQEVIDHMSDNNLGMYHIQSKQKSRLFKTLICSECDTAGLYQVA